MNIIYPTITSIIRLSGPSILTQPLHSSLLTPSNQDVPPEVFPLRDERQGQQGLQIHALNQQPEVISQDAELEESYGWLACCLERMQQIKVTNFSQCDGYYAHLVPLVILKMKTPPSRKQKRN